MRGTRRGHIVRSCRQVTVLHGGYASEHGGLRAGGHRGRPALIGKPDLDDLIKVFEKRGYRVHAVKDCPLPTANGVGGKVDPIGMAVVPVLVHKRGLVEFFMPPHSCPPLLPA
eukprot:941432-Pyramimonas_sp.AAC.1